MNPYWPAQPALQMSIKNPQWVRNALEWIAFDVSRPENEGVWNGLRILEPARTRIELFDSVWWMYFRSVQPVTRR